jgi:antitoxin PrlF
LTQVRNILTLVADKEVPFPEGDVITSKLTSKAQTTIPQPVRAALHLKEGDEIAYAIEGDRVVLSRVAAEAVEDPFATFGEWNTEADRRSYAGL